MRNDAAEFQLAQRDGGLLRSENRIGSGSRVSSRLLMLVVAVAVPLLGLSTLSIWRVHESERNVQEAALLQQARGLAQLADREFERVETGLLGLATSSALVNGDLAGTEAEMRAMSRQLDGAVITLVDTHGVQLLATDWPEGVRYRDRRAGQASRATLATGRITITNLEQAESSGDFVMAVAVPVVGGIETSRPAHAVAAAISRERLSGVLDAVHGPGSQEWVTALVDRGGTVVARTINDERRAGSPIRPFMMKRLANESEGVVHEGTTAEGVRSVFAFAHAPMSGYAVILAMPEETFEAPLRSDMLRAIGVGGLLLAAGLIAAFLMSQRLVESLRLVAEAGNGTPVRTGLLEVDDLADRLSRTAADRDRVRDAMEYQLTLLRAVSESTAEAIFLTDPHGRISFANPQAERLSGWRQEELIGQGLHAVLMYQRADGSPYEPCASPLMQALRPGGTKVEHEEVFFRRDGSTVDVDCSSSPIVMQDRTMGAALMARDVTVRKRTDKALRENEARLRDLVYTLDLAALMVRDPRGKIIFWSRGCETLYGWTASEAVGQLARKLLGTVVPNGREQMVEVLHREGSWAGDLINTCQDGRVIVVASQRVLRRDEQGQPIAIMESLTDVTALRAAEADLVRLNTQLEQRVVDEIAAREAAQVRAAHAERMQALGQLAGGIAHDFNNVLQAVAGGAALIERRPHDPPSVRRLAHVITDAASRGASITRRMLAFARRSDLEAEAIAPATLLEGLREICAYTLGAAIQIEITLEPGLPDLLADKGQLETAVVNLATNARDALPDGGVVTFAATEAYVSAGDDHHAHLAPGAYVRLSVQDTGIGMERSVLARVAEPFFTTKGVGKGTGLGLSTVKGFVEQSGGGFAIDSTFGVGTTVMLWLPQAASGSGADLVRGLQYSEADPVGRWESGRVLLVDDDLLVRDTLVAQLHDAGYGVVSASDGAEALALLERGETADILVADLSMPGMSGLSLIGAAQALCPGLPAILLTGYPGDVAALAVGGAVSGSYSLIRKPVPGSQLAERVAAMLAAVTSPSGAEHRVRMPNAI